MQNNFQVIFVKKYYLFKFYYI